MIDWNGDGQVDPTEVVLSEMILSEEESDEEPSDEYGDEPKDSWLKRLINSLHFKN